MTPSMSAKVNVRMAGGPSRSRAPSVTTTVSDVLIDQKQTVIISRNDKTLVELAQRADVV